MNELYYIGTIGTYAGRRQRGISYCDETAAYIERMSVRPSSTLIRYIDECIVVLKNAGVFAKLDVLYLFALHTSQAACLNVIKAAHNATIINSCTFTEYRGFTGDGISMYLRMNYNPLSDAVNFSLTNNSYGFYCRTSGPVGGNRIFGSHKSGRELQFLPRQSDGVMRHYNCGPYHSFSYSNITGFFYVQRINDTTSVWRNNSQIITHTSSPLNLPDHSLVILAVNNGTTTTGFAMHNISSFVIGSSLSDAERTTLYNAITLFLTRVGAAV